MVLEQIFALVMFGGVHWMLVMILLDDLANRKKVRGGKKAPWAIIIIFFVTIGAMVYLLFHPDFFYNKDDDE